jgi:RHS repeat-associated protein
MYLKSGYLYSYPNNFRGYRYRFNGKELDKEGMGGGGSTYDYGFRIYNAQLGKFLSVDPLAGEYPWYSPFHFAGNNPIVFNDLDGQEPAQTVWAIKHPVAAIRFKSNSEIAQELAKDPNLKLNFPRDGQQDAFRHAMWMALNAQSEGFELAVEFGREHERDGTDINDIKASQMDEYNNSVGARIGAANPNATPQELQALIMDALAKGEFKIIYTDQKGNYLNEEGEFLLTDGTGTWQQYKVVVNSNTPLPVEGKKNPKEESFWQYFKRAIVPGNYKDPNKARQEEIDSETK